MRRTIGLIAALATAAVVGGCSSDGGSKSGGGSGGTAPAHYRIGIFEVASASIIDQIVSGFKEGFFKDSGLSPSQVTFDVKNAQGQSQLFQTTAQYFASSSDDMIAVVGTPCVVAMAHATTTKPIVALAMGDPVGAGVATSLEAPGKNVTGSTDFVDPSKTLPQVVQLQPTPKRIGTIYDPSSPESQQWVKALQAAAPSQQVTISAVSVSGTGDVASAVRSLAGKVDLLWIGPDATATAGLPAISSVASSNKLPLLTASGDASQHGVLANVGPSITVIAQLGGAAGALVYKGTSPAKVPFGQAGDVAWTINTTTEKQLGVTIPTSISATATTVK